MPTFNYKIPPDYVGGFGSVSIGGLMKLLQRAATEHSNQLGYTAAWFRDNDTAWVARTHRIEYPGTIDSEKPVKIHTEIEDCRRVRSLRSYEVKQPESDGILASGYTDWVYVGRSNQSVKRIPDEMVDRFDPSFNDGSPNREKFNCPDPPDDSFRHSLPVQFRDLDGLNHVNNAVYFDYLLELLVQWKRNQHNTDAIAGTEFEFSVPRTNIKYLHQARWNQTIRGTVFELAGDRDDNFGFIFNSGTERIAEGTGRLT